jgi:ATPase involved in DNA repair
LSRITNAEERIGELEALEAAQLAETARKALTLSEARKSAAATMGGQVERELADLHMAGARFAVDMQFKRWKAACLWTTVRK